MAIGIVFNWTVVGWVKPRSFTAWINSGAKPSVTKPFGNSATASTASIASTGWATFCVISAVILEKFSTSDDSPVAWIALVMYLLTRERRRDCDCSVNG